jgi:menaquinone-dependent protoporphyrinogen oxidase
MTDRPILVAYDSKHGSTALIAATIAAALREAGYEVAVSPAREVSDVHRYDAAIVGSAVYAGRWRGDALKLLRHNEPLLASMPVWLFSSGPLDGTTDLDALSMGKDVAAIAQRIGARGHAWFGGALASDASGFVERLMIHNGRTGDWRDLDRVRIWARVVAATLRQPHAESVG